MKLISAVVALLLLSPQEKKNTPNDLKYDEKSGISVAKPPKNDEWDFKEKGFFDKCKIAVAHKVDELGFDILFQPPPTTGAYDLKKVAEDAFTNMSGQTGDTAPKRIE